MPKTTTKRISERRSEHLLNDLLISQGWDLGRPPLGDLLLQNEYRSYPELSEALAQASKSGPGAGVPEALLVDRSTAAPLAVIEVKPRSESISAAISEAERYADKLRSSGAHPLAIGLAGTSDDEFQLRVTKFSGQSWQPVTYDGYPISWIPTRADLERIALPTGPREIRPSVPPMEVLAARADEINRLLRESRVKDEFRPAVVAAIMLALWNSKGEIRRDQRYILRDINDSCRDAFIRAGKADLAKSLRVDEANEKLRDKARRIAKILERLNVTVLTAEHDYLGQLYEAFFRYTGGNTIGQYFTPRHIARMMVDACEVSPDDIVLDPACGTGGFLVAVMDRLIREHHLSRAQMVDVVKSHLIGFEDEPVTAALCVANMILRGDGSTGVHRADCLSSPSYPTSGATVALMNPPFPHRNTDTPVETFIDRALAGLQHKGKLAIVLPISLLVKQNKGKWREKILKKNSLLAVCQLPDELFQPFASATTSFAVIEKGVPHNAKKKTAFVRLHHDGLTLRKGVRVEREAEPNQIPEALDAIQNGLVKPGFSDLAVVSGADEWSPGAYIAAAPQGDSEMMQAVDVLFRRLASFYTRYAPEIVAQRKAIEAGEIEAVDYLQYVSKRKLTNANALSGVATEVGGAFDILYGLGEIESREGLPPGRTLIVSPTERYNGCDDWLDFSPVLQPPFITVARTGSIGEAFVHLEPCAPNSDCLVLIPRRSMSVPELILAASAIRLERWRYNYGRKITPARLIKVKLEHSKPVLNFTYDLWEKFEVVISSSLRPYQDMPQASDEDEKDIVDAVAALGEPDSASSWEDLKQAHGL